jgi:GNAT superfamily N-acetyltransferase
MWRNVCEDAVIDCGIVERCFGPVQASVFESLPSSLVFNKVLGAAEPGAVEGGYLDEALEWADSFDVSYRVTVAHDRPGMAAAEDCLNRRGFEQGSGLTKYVRDTSMPELSGVPGVIVWDIGGEEAAGETMVFDAAPALGMPSQASDLLFALPVQDHWRTYTAELDGEIVSFGSMLMHEDVAELGLDATVEGARGKGCHQALLSRRIVAAAEAGCRTIFAELSDAQHEGSAISRNLLRFGFVPAYRSVNWRRPRLWSPLS